MLQALHRGGGSLHGTISLSTGRGIAALVGRRLARRLGLPLQREHCGFAVRIAHEAGALLWQRRFDGGAQMISRFVPYGTFPDGGWHEQTGPLQLDLGVDISDGGWHWRLRGARWNGLPLPTLLLPRTDAGKRIVDGRYVFVVDFRLPLFGRVLRYEGTLDADTQ